jgi:hypothetical protein
LPSKYTDDSLVTDDVMPTSTIEGDSDVVETPATTVPGATVTTVTTVASAVTSTVPAVASTTTTVR